MAKQQVSVYDEGRAITSVLGSLEGLPTDVAARILDYARSWLDARVEPEREPPDIALPPQAPPPCSAPIGEMY